MNLTPLRSRKDPAAPVLSRIGILTLVLVGVLLLQGCGDDTRPAIDYRIQGQVSEVEGPLANVTVSAGRVDLSQPDFYGVSVRTDSDGRFVIWVPEGDYRIGVDAGFRTAYWGGSGLVPHAGQAAPVSVQPGSAVGGLDCRLSGFDLSVTTGPEREGKPLEWRLRTPVLEDVLYIDAARVENGIAHLEGRRIPPGEYRVSLKDGRDTEESADIPVTAVGEPGPSPLLRIESDTYRAYSYDLPPPAQVTFRVQSDLPLSEIAGLHLWLYDADLGFGSAYFLALFREIDESGRVTLPIAFPRALRAEVQWQLTSATGSTSAKRWIDSYSRSGATVRQVRPGQVPEEIVTIGRSLELTLVRPPRMTSTLSAHVKVTDRTGTSLADVSASVPGDSAVVRFTNLLPGEHLLQLSSGDTRIITQWFSGTGEVAESIANASLIPIPELEPTPRVRWSPILGVSFAGRVVRSDGSPAVDDFVFLTSDQGRGLLAELGRTDEDGRFRAEGFPRGRYKIGVYEAPTTLWYPGVTDWNLATVIVADELRDYEDLDLVYP